MSEYQYVSFRAIGKPVSEKNQEFMHRQSSRAEITPWAFDNEYHFGDFRGDSLEMLRRGYDIHLHYANFGTRTLQIRFPEGLPDAVAAKPYFGEGLLEFVKDKTGPGGTVSIKPLHEPDDLDQLYGIDELIDRLSPLRAEILEGDLRPFYLAHLAMAMDYEHDFDETKEAPVPAGLEKLTKAQLALAELYGLGEALVAAAAQGSPSLKAQEDRSLQQSEWLQSQPQVIKDAWLIQLMSDSHLTAKREIQAEFRKTRNAPSWPTVCRNRTITELLAAADVISEANAAKFAKKAASERAKRLAKWRQIQILFCKKLKISSSFVRRTATLKSRSCCRNFENRWRQLIGPTWLNNKLKSSKRPIPLSISSPRHSVARDFSRSKWEPSLGKLSRRYRCRNNHQFAIENLIRIWVSVILHFAVVWNGPAIKCRQRLASKDEFPHRRESSIRTACWVPRFNSISARCPTTVFWMVPDESHADLFFSDLSRSSFWMLVV